MRVGRTFLFSTLLLAGPALPAGAQIRASELGTVSQTIDGTKIALDYSRPRAKGRAPLFGGVVKWGEVWTPGANYATTLEVSKAVVLDGHAIPKGKYSVWMVVRDGGNWTLVLDPDHHRYHTEPPDSSAKQIRFPVHTVEAPFEEALTWSFSGLSVSGAVLNMRWGTTLVALPVAVAPSLRMKTPAAEAAPYLGRYDWHWTGPDSTKKIQLVLTYENGYLIGNLEPKDDYWDNFALIRLKDDWYTFGLFEKGAIYEVVREWVVEFRRGAGGAVTFEVRDDSDALQASGAKRP
jgi:hypothetical protein